MKHLFIIFFLLASKLLVAQINLTNIDLADSTKPVVYQGIENRIKLTGVTFNNYTELRTSQGAIKLSEKERNQFYLYSNRIGFDTVSLIRNGKVILQKIFEVRRFPEPVLTLRGSVKTDYTVQQLVAMSNPKLKVILPNCLYKGISFEVIKFRIDIYNSTGELIFSANENGSILKEHILTIINTLSPGSKITFDAGISGLNRCRVSGLDLSLLITD